MIAAVGVLRKIAHTPGIGWSPESTTCVIVPGESDAFSNNRPTRRRSVASREWKTAAADRMRALSICGLATSCGEE
jgi:hypothetical protein